MGFPIASLPVIFLSYSVARTRPPALFYNNHPLPLFMMDRLHWLHIRARIDFKIATLTYNTLTFGHPAYLRELISPYQPSRLLRSGKQLLLTVPRAKLAIGQRAFSYSSPVIWNAIPSVRDAPSVSTFKRRLKSLGRPYGVTGGLIKC